jgi:hypothetical protein
LRHSLRFTVSDDSTSANCPFLGSPGNPNAQLISPNLFSPGRNVYIGFSVYIPPAFPQICRPRVSGCFFSFMEVYGPPFNGPGPFALMGAGSHFALGTHVNPDAWTSPRWTPGTWSNFVLHVNFATDDTGYVELWFNNGVRQRLSNDRTRLYEPTLLYGVNWDGSTPDHLALQQYRSDGVSMGTVITYESGAQVGETYQSVSGM